MQKIKTYNDAFFSPETLRKATQAFESFATQSVSEAMPSAKGSSYAITKDFESWNFDNAEEFMAEYVKNPWGASYHLRIGFYKFEVEFRDRENKTVVLVSGEGRRSIESVFNIFEEHYDESRRHRETPKKEIRIFIGHGHSSQWKDLKDHLQDKHGYKIEAYEIGARAGHGIRDILEDMLMKSTFALLVMTGEDVDQEGIIHPRDNVIHELGLFQGRLGFSKAIVLLEDGTQEFSNIAGIHQLRYAKNNIKETFGEVIATVRREFKD